MKGETVAAIAAVASAVIAIAAAVTSKRSADRSAAAEERSASEAARSARAAERSAETAEETLAIERERFAVERDQREAAEAPVIDVGERARRSWTLAQQGRALVGEVSNFGPGSALIESVALEVSAGERVLAEAGDSESGDPYAAAGLIVMEAQSVRQFVIPWPYGEDVPSFPLALWVTYQAGNSDYRARAPFTLIRAGANPNGEPLWRSASRGLRRL